MKKIIYGILLLMAIQVQAAYKVWPLPNEWTYTNDAGYVKWQEIPSTPVAQYDLQVTWSTNNTHPVNGNYFVAGWYLTNPNYIGLTNATAGSNLFYNSAEESWTFVTPDSSVNNSHYATNTFDVGIVATSRVPVIIYGTNDYCGDYEEVHTNYPEGRGEVTYYEKTGTPTWRLIPQGATELVDSRWVLITNDIVDESMFYFTDISQFLYGFYSVGMVLNANSSWTPYTINRSFKLKQSYTYQDRSYFLVCNRNRIFLSRIAL